MRRTRQWLSIAIVAVLAAAAGYAYNAWRLGPQESAREAIGTLMAAQLADLDGRPQQLEQWRGKVMIVNFWATWCAPCREEIPVFVKLQEKYAARGVQFVGIAIDQPDKVRPYAAEMGMNFPVLIGNADAIELARALGNRAGVLPYTVVIDRSGKAAARQIGIYRQPAIEAILTPLL